jgi:copper chaperone CopZ
MIKSLSYLITGDEKIRCEGCERRITNALKGLNGVRQVSANAASQQVTVAIDTDVLHQDQLQRRLAQLGYEVQSA